MESFKNIIVEVTHDVSGFINPINLLHRKKDGNVTNKKILQIRRNSAITLFCFSIGMIIVFVITFSISTTYLVRDFYEKIELPGRTFFFLFSFTSLGLLGAIIGFAELTSPNMRTFIAYHAYDTEDDIEDIPENLDKYQTSV